MNNGKLKITKIGVFDSLIFIYIYQRIINHVRVLFLRIYYISIMYDKKKKFNIL